MLLKKIIVLPVIAFFILAFANLVTGNFWLFAVWSMIMVLTLLVVYPIIANKNDKVVPIIQIFVSLLAGLVFASLVAIFDFQKIGTYSAAESISFGIFFGIGSIALIMLIKGK